MNKALHILSGILGTMMPYFVEWGTGAIPWREAAALSSGTFVLWLLSFTHLSATETQAAASATTKIIEREIHQGP